MFGGRGGLWSQRRRLDEPARLARALWGRVRCAGSSDPQPFGDRAATAETARERYFALCACTAAKSFASAFGWQPRQLASRGSTIPASIAFARSRITAAGQ
jgi:hypothetical protein